jgi:flavorubredoxin
MILEPFHLHEYAAVVPCYWHTPGAPVGVHLNSMVLRSAEPVLFDTSVACVRDGWLDAVGSLVDFADVRWVVLTHDDPDHVGNLGAVLELCPKATVVANWFMCERLSTEVELDPRRLRWVGDRETLDIGDRELVFLRPPLYDSPTTRVVFDPASRVLWAADLFAAPVPVATNDAADVDPGAYEEGFLAFQRWNSPWHELVDPVRYNAEVDRLHSVGAATIASTHGPALRGATVERGFELLRRVIDDATPPMPGQPVLDQIVASLPADLIE